MKKQITDCLKGGAAGLCVGMAVAWATTSRCSAGICLKKNVNKMMKGVDGVVKSLKKMI